jgi:hypothetical protein
MQSRSSGRILSLAHLGSPSCIRHLDGEEPGNAGMGKWNGLSRGQLLRGIDERRDRDQHFWAMPRVAIVENPLKEENNVRCSLGRGVRNADEAEYHQRIQEGHVRVVVLVTPRLASLHLLVVNFHLLGCTSACKCEQQPRPGGPSDRFHGTDTAKMLPDEFFHGRHLIRKRRES